jgi:ribose transport system substrate-binding protein
MCGNGGENVTIAIVPRALNNPVFDITKTGAEDRAKELGNVTIEWVGPTTSGAAEQAQIVDQVANKGADGIVVYVNEPGALKPSIDRAVEAGTPVLTWGADSPDSKRFALLGIDQAAAGKQAGEMLAKNLPNGGKIAILTGTPGSLDIEQRVKGFMEGIASNPKIEVVATDPNYDDVQKAVQLVEQRINATPDLAGYFFAGMWPFFADLNSLPSVKDFVSNGGYVTSLDSLPGALNAVSDGYANSLVGYSWWGFGRSAVDIVCDKIAGKADIPVNVNTPTYIVDTTNIAEYQQKQKDTNGRF